MLATFDIHEPATVEEASRLLATHGPDAAIYAGGTELLVLMKDRLINVPHLVNIKKIAGLDQIEIDRETGALRIGALVTHRALEKSELLREHAPEIAEMEAHVANIRVRGAGTIGGNLCFGEPHSDPATLFIAWGATFILASAEGTREVPAEEFFIGLLETAREPHELLTEIVIPRLPAGAGVAYERFKTHERPTATAAAVLRLEEGRISEARIVAGSVGPYPTRIAAAEALLVGQAPTAERFAAAAQAAHDGVDPTEDAFESTDYKRHLVRVLTERALASAAQRAAGPEGAGNGH